MLTGDSKRLQKLEQSLRELGQRDGTMLTEATKQIAKNIKDTLKEEFSQGEGPYGAWLRTVRGRTALLSRKLPQAFAFRADNFVLKFFLRVPWLTAHQTGYKFSARQAKSQSLFFNEEGRLLKLGRLNGARLKKINFVQEVKGRAHTVGARVLPARPIFPTSAGVPPKWAQRINEGANYGMQRWYQKASK